MPRPLSRPLRSVLLVALALLLLPAGNARAANSWMTIAAAPVARFLAGSATAPDGKIYVIGGWNADGTDSVSNADVYDPATNHWTVLPNMPTKRTELGVAVAGGKVYAIGGLYIGAQSAYQVGLVEIYDPGTKQWTTGNSMNTPRNALAITVGSDGKIYAIGGVAASSYNPVATVERYDPAADSWSYVAPLNQARQYLAATLGPDGKIYAIGGRIQGLTYLPTVESYDVSTNHWTVRKSLTYAREGPGAAAGGDGRIYVAGGDHGTTDLTSVEVYSTATNTWTAGTGLPIGTGGLTLNASGGKLYAVGGVQQGATAATTAGYVFTPTGTTAAPVRNFRVAHRGARLRFTWRVPQPASVLSFDVLAGRSRLNRRAIFATRSHVYSFVTATERGPYRLRVVLRTGQARLLGAGQ